jgi:hypothetical protein
MSDNAETIIHKPPDEERDLANTLLHLNTEVIKQKSGTRRSDDQIKHDLEQLSKRVKYTQEQIVTQKINDSIFVQPFLVAAKPFEHTILEMVAERLGNRGEYDHTLRSVVTDNSENEVGIREYRVLQFGNPIFDMKKKKWVPAIERFTNTGMHEDDAAHFGSLMKNESVLRLVYRKLPPT